MPPAFMKTQSKFMIQSEVVTRKITATQFHENTGKTIMPEVFASSCYESIFMIQSEAVTSNITATQFHEHTIEIHDLE